MGVHIIILYASERKIAAEVKAFAAGSRRIWSRGCKEKHPTMLKIATDDAKISCRRRVCQNSPFTITAKQKQHYHATVTIF